MFRNSPFANFDNDPFFSMQQQQMQRMHQMMADPFGLMNQSMLALDNRPQQLTNNRNSQSLMPFSPFGQSMLSPFGGFGGMSSMMAQMNQMMEQARSNPTGEGQFFSQSSVMTYSNVGDGKPQVYQATSSVRQAPGGVRETRKSVRDTRSGIEKVEVGHRIKDRARIVSKSRNVHTGDTEENQELENLDEDETESFNREWHQRTAPYSRKRTSRHEVEGGRRRNTPALEYHD